MGTTWALCVIDCARRRVQALEYDYEMFATEEGRSVFAAADLDGDGRIDMAGFSKIVHVRPHPYSTVSIKSTTLHDMCTWHARACHATRDSHTRLHAFPAAHTQD